MFSSLSDDGLPETTRYQLNLLKTSWFTSYLSLSFIRGKIPYLFDYLDCTRLTEMDLFLRETDISLAEFFPSLRIACLSSPGTVWSSFLPFSLIGLVAPSLQDLRLQGLAYTDLQSSPASAKRLQPSSCPQVGQKKTKIPGHLGHLGAPSVPPVCP
jgi:hypothetical protein